MCVFFQFFNSIQCALLLRVTVKQERVPINVISQNGLSNEGSVRFPSYQQREKVSQAVPRAGNLQGAQTCCAALSPGHWLGHPSGPHSLLSSLFTTWPLPVGQCSHTQLLPLGFLQIVKPVYCMCFTASCGSCVSHEALPFLLGWIISS